MKKILTLLLASMLVLSMAGCGTTETGDGDNVDHEFRASTSEQPGTEEGSVADFAVIRDPSGSDGKIHVITKALLGGFWELIRQGALDMNGADSVGGSEVLLYSPLVDGDAQKQLELFEAVLQQNPMAIVISPIAKDSVAPICEEAYDMGIPVVLFDDDITTEKYDAFYATNNYEVAREVAKIVGESMGGEGEYAVISGSAQSAAEEARVDGFIDAMTELYPNIKQVGGGTQYTNYDETKYYSLGYDILAANPNVDCIYSAFNKIANGVSVALQEQGKSPGDVLLPTWDTDTDGITLTEQGWITGFMQQNPYGEVQLAIKRAYDLAVGNVQRTGIPEKIDMDYMWITPENINTNEVQAFLHPAEIQEEYDVISE